MAWSFSHEPTSLKGTRRQGVRAWFFIFLVSLNICNAKANEQWSSWEKFKQYYISADGRVIDTQTPDKRTTSEGQSYALFFALIVQDKVLFDKLLHWTESNLAAGDLGKHLPAWLWGKNKKNQWMVLDSNSAADADLWLAYDLLEAGRLWKQASYSILGKKLLQRILNEEVTKIPGLGLMLLPGKVGFHFKNNWRLNPSYLPLQLLTRFATINRKWRVLKRNSRRLLLETSPKGFAPDWVVWNNGKGWRSDQKYPNLGSYDAIRVYLWVGMLAKDAPQEEIVVTHFSPIITLIQQLGFVPEKIDIRSGKTQGKGSIGFVAALLPLLSNNPPELAIQRQRIYADELSADNYYSSVLRLFGQGWDERRYRFNAQGELLLP
ncbi:MAG: cellulase [Legionella longbeachae]|nr:cellulase [Legionella longbeachae]